MFRPVKPLLQPTSIAIVGATDSGGDGWSQVLFRNLEETGFPVPTYLVNPRRTELWGHRVYPDFGALPEAIDHALVIVPARFVNDIMRDGIAHGLKAATIFSAGFGEGRKRIGAARGEELRELIDNSGVSVCGPNCMGLFSLPRDILLYPTARLRNLPKGPVGGIFHSGGTLGYWFAQAAQRGLGFSYAMSCGNEIGLDSADYLDFLVSDPDTEIIVGMIESIRRPKALMEAAGRALEAGKPFIVTKLGRSELGKEQARTHTGAVAVDDDIFSAMCRRYGVTRCNSIDEMVEFALAFGQKRLPRGSRAAIVTSSGGAVGLCVDTVEAENGVLAELTPETVERMENFVPEGVDVDNPMDAGASLAQKVPEFCELCEMFADDDNVDIVAIQGRVPLPGDRVKSPENYVRLRESTDKPVLAFTRMAQNADEHLRQFQAGSRIPFLFGVPAAVRSTQALILYAEARRRGLAALPQPDPGARELPLAELSVHLAQHGLTAPVQLQTAPDPEAVADATLEIGFPVALKIVSTEISHKTEVDGVRLGLEDADAVRAATAELLFRLGTETVDGFLVQEMVEGVEMLLGIRDDPGFGPVLIVGFGGIFVELLHDVALRLAPVDEDEAFEMLQELRGAAVLGEFRSRAPRDKSALCKAIAGFSEFYLKNREWLEEIEINPLIVLGDGEGVRAVDVRHVRRKTLS